MKKITLALSCVALLSGCAQQTYNKWDLSDNLENSFEEVATEIVSNVPEVMYCYNYSREAFIEKFRTAYIEALDIITDDYQSNLTEPEVKKFGVDVGGLASAIYVSNNKDNLRLDILTISQKKKCVQVMTPSEELLSKR